MTTVPFDLDAAGKLCRGVLTWESNVIYADIDGVEVFRRSLDGVAELTQFGDVGCGRLELKLPDQGNEHNIAVCRFSMSHVSEIGEFCKVVNHYLQSGKRVDIDYKVLQRCEKCGRHLIPGLSICLFCADVKSVWLRAIRDFPRLKPAMVKANVFMLLFNLARASVPLIIGWLIRTVLNPDYAAEATFGWATGSAVWLAGLAMAIFYLSSMFFHSASLLAINRTSVRHSDFLRRKTYDKVQQLSLTSMSKRTAGDLMKRVTHDTETVRGFVDGMGRATLEKMMMIVIVSIILFVLNPALAAMTVIAIPVTLVLHRKFWVRLRLKIEKMWRCGSRERSLLHDIIKGIRVVKTFGTEEREIEKFKRTSWRLKKAATAVEVFWALLNPTTRLAMMTGELVVMFVGGWQVLQGNMEIDELVMFTLLMAFLFEPLRWMSFFPRRLAEATNSLLKIYEILDEEHTMVVAEEPINAPVEGPLVFENLRFGYVPYEPVLKNINLTVQPGEMLGLVGPSGAGKSTLINLAMRMYDPDSGRITLKGQDLRDFDSAWLHKHIGVVFQETYLFAGTVYENIAYGSTDATPEGVIRAAKTANAHEFIIKLPDGYNTLVGEDGHTLSGGERQRVAIARAVLRNPKILILDEATSALDPETEGKVQQALERLVKGRVTIAIAHRLSTLRHANRLAVIDGGEIAELGSHRELMQKRGIYYNLVTTQRQMSKETDEKGASEEDKENER
ncbi:MAG: ABC transporter ATP-binding protein/permease [Oscillospiraceae bacterium]|nr:ABC transporter ATP-binding protein/permease [Oscillospiraceae bacterium]